MTSGGGVAGRRHGKKSHQRAAAKRGEILNAILFATHAKCVCSAAAKQQTVWRTAGWIMEMHHIIPQLLLLGQDRLLQDNVLQDNLLRNVWGRACNYATYCLFASGTAIARRTQIHWKVLGKAVKLNRKI